MSEPVDPLEYVMRETGKLLGTSSDLEQQTQDILDLCETIIEKTNETAELVKSMRAAMDGGELRG